MRIMDHLDKVEAFERALTKLDPLVDSRLYAWLSEKAATHCVNAALHAWGITPEQPEGAQVLLERADVPRTEWADAARYHDMASQGDLIHTRYKPVEVRLTAKAEVLFEKLAFFEIEREKYVRGDAVLDSDAIRQWRKVYAEIRHSLPDSLGKVQ